MIQSFLLLYVFSFVAWGQFSLYAQQLPAKDIKSAKNRKKQTIAGQLNCRQTYKILAYKKKTKKKKISLKNRLLFCDGHLVSSMFAEDGYDSVPEAFHRWIKKYKKAYIFHIAHQSDSKKKKNILNFYLLSNDKESKVILSKKQKLEFSGQIVQKPVFLDKAWHFLVLKEEMAIKIE